MINLNAIYSSPVLFALEPYHALCDYVAGCTRRLDSSLYGDGHPVLVLPGLGVSGSATADLRMRLQLLGYAVYDWKHGINNGHGTDLDWRLQLLGDHLLEINSEHDSTVSIIGWSLGGMYAREIAKEYPDVVRQVITLASPFGETDFTSRPLSEAPLVRSSSIYSQTDGIVNWESCVGDESVGHRNIEVKGVSHFGMVHHPDVLKVVAEILKSPVLDD
jgi:alpha/beta superfamily hydrolase